MMVDYYMNTQPCLQNQNDNDIQKSNDNFLTGHLWLTSVVFEKRRIFRSGLDKAFDGGSY